MRKILTVLARASWNLRVDGHNALARLALSRRLDTGAVFGYNGPALTIPA
jgi:hypothetical protein